MTATRRITMALAGNPNSGKTTIFNALTGQRQHVGNYPGVTVETKAGTRSHRGVEIEVVDLPGTYSLTAYSLEELVARRFIVEQRPDVLVDIVDSANLERNLYLAVQFMELGAPLVLAFNMSDVAKARGIQFNLERLSVLLGAPIAATVGHKAQGIERLLDEVLRVADRPEAAEPRQVQYGREIEEEIARIQGLLEADESTGRRYPARWLAIKLLENDAEVRKLVASEEVLRQLDASSRHLETIFGEAPEIVIAGRRYGFISGACQEAVRFTVEARHTLSDKIDAVLINPLVGLPIFLLLMYGVFYLTFTVADYPTGWLEQLFGWLGGSITRLWPRGSESLLRSLLADGIIGGVGGVIGFLPNILLLFLAIAFLEDSGYMARAAFLMDRLMHRIGLHGKSFIPMLIGFGCSVPAILATRTLESRRDRLVTMLIVPLMSCGARLTIYSLIIPAFFAPAWRAPMLWGIYLIGIALAIGCAKLLRVTVLRGEAPAFVMELPLYRLPTLRALVVHMWDRAWMYLRKAGTIILAASVILWAMTTFPRKSSFERDYVAEAAEARAALLAGAKGLNAPLGLPADSNALAMRLGAELDLAEQEERHWPHEMAALAAARALFIEQPTFLRGDPSDEGLGRFLAVREQVVRVRRQFDEALEASRIRKGTPQHAAAVLARRHALEDIERADPGSYGAVVRYLDEMKAPFDRQRRDLRHARRAEELAFTVAGRTGRALEPALKLLGFDWRIGTALIGAFAAKEVFVAQMGIVFAVGEGQEGSEVLRARLQARYTPLQAFCIMLFCLISMPCVATFACTWKESESWKWAVFQLAGLTVLAYVVTLIAYQLGRLIA
jgi:ferrous iron transport protein B